MAVADFIAPPVPLSSAMDSSPHANRPSKRKKKSSPEPYRPRPIDVDKLSGIWMPLPEEPKHCRARRHGSRLRSLSPFHAARGAREAPEEHLNRGTVADLVAPPEPMSSAKDSSPHADRPSKRKKKSSAEPYRPRPIEDDKKSGIWTPLPVEPKDGRARRHASRAARGAREAPEEHLDRGTVADLIAPPQPMSSAKDSSPHADRPSKRKKSSPEPYRPRSVDDDKKSGIWTLPVEPKEGRARRHASRAARDAREALEEHLNRGAVAHLIAPPEPSSSAKDSSPHADRPSKRKKKSSAEPYRPRSVDVDKKSGILMLLTEEPKHGRARRHGSRAARGAREAPEKHLDRGTVPDLVAPPEPMSSKRKKKSSAEPYRPRSVDVDKKSSKGRPLPVEPKDGRARRHGSRAARGAREAPEEHLDRGTVADLVAPPQLMSSKWKKKSSAEPYRPRPVDDDKKSSKGRPLRVEPKDGRARRHGSRLRSFSPPHAARGTHETPEDCLTGGRCPGAPSKPSPSANAQLEERIRALFTNFRMEQDEHETDSTSSESSASVYLVQEESLEDSSTESDSDADSDGRTSIENAACGVPSRDTRSGRKA